jgi:DNA-binding CsgD family transcriptional regulator
MREIDEPLTRRPELGTLAGEAAALRAQLSKERGPSIPTASALTAAELRVLPMLATHQSFPEIGAEMFLSPHTVKSQAMSIYRKLGASSRNQAVTRSRVRRRWWRRRPRRLADPSTGPVAGQRHLSRQPGIPRPGVSVPVRNRGR